MITISPGHWLPGTGAKDIIDEVTEARKVVNRVGEILRRNGITVNHIEDNTSKNQQQNLTYLVTQHNKTNRKLDVSIHFNKSGGRVNRGIGVEVLYKTQKDLSVKVSKAISDASGLINRGAKLRTDLAFLNGTNKPAILIEVCFVNSTVDVAIYKEKFEKICYAIAEKLAEFVGKSINSKVDKKEESNVWDPKSPTMYTAAEQFIEQAVKDGIIQKQHLDDIRNKQMSTDRLLGLYITIQQRKNK